MHGTWVNCKKISADKDVPIHSGDVVIFGTEVIRGESMPSTSIVISCQSLADSLTLSRHLSAHESSLRVPMV